MKILTGWVVGLLRYQRSLQAPPEADKRANSLSPVTTFLGKRYGFDNIIGGDSHVKQLHMHTKITPVIYDEENKYRHSAKDMFNRTDLKSFHKDLSVNGNNEIRF